MDQVVICTKNDKECTLYLPYFTAYVSPRMRLVVLFCFAFERKISSQLLFFYISEEAFVSQTMAVWSSLFAIQVINSVVTS